MPCRCTRKSVGRDHHGASASAKRSVGAIAAETGDWQLALTTEKPRPGQGVFPWHPSAKLEGGGKTGSCRQTRSRASDFSQHCSLSWLRRVPMTDATGNPLRLMFVHAHPDDETTTTGAHNRAVCRGGRRRRAGPAAVPGANAAKMLAPDLAAQLSDPDPDKAARLLGAHRERELAGACQVLGIGPARSPGGAGRWWGLGRDRRGWYSGRPGTGRR